MKKPIKGTLQEADHSPVWVGDKLIFVPESKGGGDKPRPPRGPSKLDLILKRLEEQGDNIKAIQSDIGDLKTRMIRVEQRLDKHDENFKVVFDYIKSRP